MHDEGTGGEHSDLYRILVLLRRVGGIVRMARWTNVRGLHTIPWEGCHFTCVMDSPELVACASSSLDESAILVPAVWRCQLRSQYRHRLTMRVFEK